MGWYAETTIAWYDTLNRRVKKLEQRSPSVCSYLSPTFFIEYCCIIWGNARKKLIDDLLILQKRAARLALDQEPRIHRL
jgi:hypothetical protein